MTEQLAAISGVYETEIGRTAGLGYLALGADALRGALFDARLPWTALDGLITTESQVTYYNRPALALAEYCGVQEQLKYCSSPQLGGAAPFAAVAEAARLISAGVCDVVAVVSADVPRTGQSRTSSVDQFAQMRDPDYEQPFGLSNVAAYALLAQYHLWMGGSTPQQRAAVAATFRTYAENNSSAVYREPLSVDDVLASRIVADPLHLLECRPICDGGGAFIMSRASVASSDKSAVYLRGYGMGFTHDQVSQLGDLARTGCYLSSARAYSMAGIERRNILSYVDVAALYDSYTVTVLLELEGLGICAPGGSGEFIASGELGIDGQLPTNTHGGCLSHGGPGICHIVEAIRQLRDESPNQIPGARTALVTGEGGILSANCTLVLSTD